MILLSIILNLSFIVENELDQLNMSFEFFKLKSEQFRVINDDVMGGMSSSEIKLLEGGVNFSGTISLENNGGFASVRMLWPFANKSVEDNLGSVVLKVKGDGKKYQFRLRTNRGFDGAAYSSVFSTLKNQVQTIELGVDEFMPTFRGRKLKNMPKLKLSNVQQMGVLVSDQQEGHFDIDLYGIELK